MYCWHRAAHQRAQQVLHGESMAHRSTLGHLPPPSWRKIHPRLRSVQPKRAYFHNALKWARAYNIVTVAHTHTAPMHCPLWRRTPSMIYVPNVHPPSIFFPLTHNCHKHMQLSGSLPTLHILSHEDADNYPSFQGNIILQRGHHHELA